MFTIKSSVEPDLNNKGLKNSHIKALVIVIPKLEKHH